MALGQFLWFEKAQFNRLYVPWRQKERLREGRKQQEEEGSQGEPEREDRERPWGGGWVRTKYKRLMHENTIMKPIALYINVKN